MFKKITGFSNFKFWKNSRFLIFNFGLNSEAIIRINWKRNQENILRRLAEAKFKKKREKLANGGIEPRTVTLSQPKRSGPLYILVENAICESHISDRRHYVV